ncbi:O-antigen ligase family protein [Actinopolymorpha alba]|uniref:O-antigen ligase family protein n=1 Tax=Actinopolymorpha alba TaxID=533267 RepID=UPI00039AF2D5|nr:O-antigen ligase family protein [Actinopolymorpha alba]
MVANVPPWLLAGVAAVSVFSPAVADVAGSITCAVLLAFHLRRLRIRAPEIFASLFTAFAVLSIAWAVAPEWTWDTARAQLTALAIFLAIRTVVTERWRLAVVAWGYLSGCLVAIVLLIRDNPTMPLLVAGLSTDRYGIDGVNFNNLAYALATGIAVAVLLWSLYPSGWVRSVLAVSALAMLFGILQTGCRGALAGVVLVALWLLVHRFIFRWGIVVLSAGIGLVSLVVSSGLMNVALRMLDAVTVRSTGDLTYRLLLWPYAKQVFVEHWLVGVGAGGFKTLPPNYWYAHNVFLEIATGLGIIGLLLFLATVFSSLIMATRGASARTLVVGSVLVCWVPMWLSAHWELESALWLTTGLFSALGARGQPAKTTTETSDVPEADHVKAIQAPAGFLEMPERTQKSSETVS